MHSLLTMFNFKISILKIYLERMEYKLGSISVSDQSAEQIITISLTNLEHSKSTYIVTLNPEIFIGIQTNNELEQIVKSADFIVPDGQGIVWGVQQIHKIRLKVCPGVELAEKLIKSSIKKKLPIAIIGGKDEEIQRASIEIRNWGLTTDFLYTHNGYFNHEYDKVIKEILEFKPSVVLVGMGFPKQDQLIERLKLNKLTAVYVGIGGSIKIWAGLEKRAPKLIQRLRLEWCWRTFKDPARIKRLTIIPKFIQNINQLKRKQSKVDTE